MKRWIKQYKEFGYDSLVNLQSGGNYKEVISASLHQALEAKVNNSDQPLLGYWYAVDWVKENFNQDVKYQTLRSYLIRHFKTKKKHPRKSHYKKDQQVLEVFKKLPNTLEQLRLSPDNNYKSVNLYFQDESRFGIMTHVGTALTAKGVKPIVNYQQAFKNTYLYGSYSPIDGSNFTWEIEGVDTLIFEAYLNAFSLYKPEELKIVIIDNAGFHSTKKITIPDNIKLIRIPPYAPELNPCEKVWQYLKERFKNKTFKDIQALKEWIHQIVKEKIIPENIISIVKNEFYTKTLKACFNS